MKPTHISVEEEISIFDLFLMVAGLGIIAAVRRENSKKMKRSKVKKD